MMIRIKVKGSTRKTESFIRRHKKIQLKALDKYGEMGVKALSEATPVRTGLTAASWYYTIKESATGFSIVFNNSNVVDGYPVAILIQYGHGTKTGAYVEGIDYINPALDKVFKAIAHDAYLEVTK
jgi:hypothetical protein